MKKILMLLLVVCLNGCYIFKMDDNLRAMYGQPIETAFQALGVPDNSVNVRGMKVYIWSRAQKYSYTTRESADSFGSTGMTRFSSTMFYDVPRTGLSTIEESGAVMLRFSAFVLPVSVSFAGRQVRRRWCWNLPYCRLRRQLRFSYRGWFQHCRF